MPYLVSLDVETNYQNEVMSVGVVIGDKNTFELVDKQYFVIVEAWKKGGMYADPEHMRHEDGYVKGNHDYIIAAIKKMFSKYHTEDVFAYNATFDKSHLPELSRYMWHDIMALAAYKQYNPAIPRDAECYSTGRLKRNYKVEDIMHMFGEKGYTERHNALQDAIDELRLMKHLNIGMYTYHMFARI